MLESGAFIVFAVAMASTVLLLGIGCAVGNYFGRQCAPRAVTSSQAVAQTGRVSRADANEMAETSRKLKDEAAALSQILADHRQAVPRELACAIERLAFTSYRIAKQVQTFNDPEVAARPPNPSLAQATEPALTASKKPETVCLPPADSTVSPTATGTLTPDEMRSFRIAAGAAPVADDDSTKRRYPYDCFQTVVPKVNGVIIPMRASKVRCHEISAHGLWFFWPDVPDFDRAMISLGSERDPIFVRAEIVQSKAVFMHKEVQVLVECRFTGRYQSPAFNGKAIDPSGSACVASSAVLAAQS